MTKNKLQTALSEIDKELEERELRLIEREEAVAKREEAAQLTEQGFLDRQLELEKKELELAKSAETVDQKLSKVRSDEQLTLALQKQAEELKQIDKLAKTVAEERALTEYNLSEVSRREKALTEREANYKQEVELQIAKQFLNSKGN